MLRNLNFHEREAARLRSLLSVATTPTLKAQLLSRVEEHERLQDIKASFADANPFEGAAIDLAVQRARLNEGKQDEDRAKGKERYAKAKDQARRRREALRTPIIPNVLTRISAAELLRLASEVEVRS